MNRPRVVFGAPLGGIVLEPLRFRAAMYIMIMRKATEFVLFIGGAKD
jgi:hypothetical protein